jgi:two-component system, chemotaxis family, sensor kinase CheA
MNEFLQQFLIESRELVVEATEGLLLLERSPRNAESLDSVFRAFHTLKGGAGIVEFPAMEHALHATETVLTEVRSGRRDLTPAVVSDCLASLDQVSQWLDTLEQTGELPEVRADDATSIAANRAVPQWTVDLLARHPSVHGQAATAFRFVPEPDCFYAGEDPIAQASALPQLLAFEFEPANPWPPLDEFDPSTCNLVLTGLTAASTRDVMLHMQGHSGECEVVAIAQTASPHGSLPRPVRDLLEEQMAILDRKQAPGAAGRLASAGLTAANAMRSCGRDLEAEALARATQEGVEKSAALRGAIARLLAADSEVLSPSPQSAQRTETSTRTLRVDAEQIDALVRLTGELTVAKNAIGHTAKLALLNGDSIANLLKDNHAGLNRLIAQLQNSVIGMRVLPLRSVFQRFPRVLREMSANLGKPTELQVEGENTEADKTIVEMLFEPLLHVVRNAIDHGVEDAERRRKSGKSAVATILMRARRDADQVLIEVSDDGAGIDVERVRSAAQDRGVATEEDLRVMPESEVIDLVFAPGFSTAERVTELSGRGVGMDAVRTAVEKVGGRVSIASRAGQGTTVGISVPFSVMMTHVMTVEAGGQVFGIPLDAIVETVSVGRQAFSDVGNARVIVHRNRTIPVVELDAMLRGGQDKPLSDEAHATVIITAAGGQLVGIHVDRPGERMEVILKPLDGLLSGTPGIAGTTVLGDGRVLLVLDIAEVLQ